MQLQEGIVVQKTSEAATGETDTDYFNTELFDPAKYELQKLDTLDVIAINNRCEKLSNQYMVVSEMCTQLVLKKQSQYNEAFSRIADIYQQVCLIARLCREARRNLNKARRQFTTSNLSALANCRKKQILKQMIRSLVMIKTLQSAEERSHQFLNDGNYVSAVTLLMESQRVTSKHSQLNCVLALAGKLQDTLEIAEDQLREALQTICYKFEPRLYHEVTEAYRLLGKTQLASDQLYMNFMFLVRTRTVDVVHQFVDANDSRCERSLPFGELFKSVSSENFVACLVNLCSVFWEIMLGYKQMIAWHKNNNLQELSGTDSETSCGENYIQQKLEKETSRLWHDIQARILAYLTNCDISMYQFDEFVRILRVTQKFIDIGEEFTGIKPEYLSNYARQQSINYFRLYHRERLKELTIFLENERWEMIPLKNDFTVLQLHDFRCLDNYLDELRFSEDHSSESTLNRSRTSDRWNGYFTQCIDTKSPFEPICSEDQEEDILVQQLKVCESDESAEQLNDSADDISTSPATPEQCQHILQTPVVTNTSLDIMRCSAKYLLLNYLLGQAASVTGEIAMLYEYYMYSVYSFFGSALQKPKNYELSLKLQVALKHIELSLILPEGSELDIHSRENKLPVPVMSSGIALDRAENLYGLQERITAVESLIYLAEQSDYLKPYLDQMQGQRRANASSFCHFYRHSLDAAKDLRGPVYMRVCERIINSEGMLKSMGKVDWDMEDIPSSHSRYVDELLDQLKTFSVRLKQVCNSPPVLPEVEEILWNNVTQLVCNTFVDGFSSIMECSDAGRALMQLDFTKFVMELEKLVPFRLAESVDFVDSYVKAYYLQDCALESWIREHREYSRKQLLALVSCTCRSKKKAFQRLCALVEELDSYTEDYTIQ